MSQDPNTIPAAITQTTLRRLYALGQQFTLDWAERLAAAIDAGDAPDLLAFLGDAVEPGEGSSYVYTDDIRDALEPLFGDDAHAETFALDRVEGVMRWRVATMRDGAEVIRLSAVVSDLAYERWSAVVTASEDADSIDLRDSLRALAGPEPQRGEREVGGFSVWHPADPKAPLSIGVTWSALRCDTVCALLDAADALGRHVEVLYYLRRLHIDDPLARPAVHPAVSDLLAEIAEAYESCAGL